MPRNRSIRSKLFTNFSFLIIALELIIFISFFFFYSNILKNQSREHLNSLSLSLSEWMDDEIRYMEDVAFRIAYSSMVYDYLSESGMELSPVREYYINRDLLDVLNISMGYYRKTEQINLYTLNGKVIRSGYHSDIIERDVREEDWYDDLLSRKRTISQSYWKKDLRKNVFALRMVYFNRFNEPIGVIEIIQDYSFIQQKIDNIYSATGSLALKTAFISSTGEMIYPEEDTDSFFMEIGTEQSDNIGIRKSHPLFYVSNENLISLIISADTDWMTIVTGSQKDLFSRLTDFYWTFLILSIFSIILSLIVSYTIAHKLSYPLGKIDRMILTRSQDIIPDLPVEGLNSGIRELENLYSTLYKMQKNLKRSVNDSLVAKEEEMNAKMLALQSQMNPHFLYNVLSMINVMAEENDAAGIISVTEELSSMLRYITKGAESELPMFMEAEHTVSYLNLMKFRYEDHFDFTVHIDDELRNVPIPKLSIQPFVENIFKHGFTNRPPWKIDVNALGNPQCWDITIDDNGCGFNPDLLEKLMSRLEQLEDSSDFSLPSIDGMGIVNIFLRMKIIFAEAFTLKIINRKDRGSTIHMSFRDGV